MTPLQPDALRAKLAGWIGQDVYIHLEVNPGAYWRNGRARLSDVHVKGNGPYRVYLELDGRHGLIQVDDVTHMSLTDELVICTAYDDLDRIARTLEVSISPFSV